MAAMSGLTMLVWSLRTWPKAQYLARALEIPAQAWEVPFLMVPVGGPEVSVFEAMERPNYGGLTERLKALTKPLAAAAYEDPWVKRSLLADSKLAVAFHTGASMALVAELSAKDGYRVMTMAEALAERGDDAEALGEGLEGEGLLDAHGRMREAWTGLEDDEVVRRTLALPVWSGRHHSAAFWLASRREDWGRLRELGASEEAMAALSALVHEDLEHPVIVERWDKATR
jgi:hypothetical protein